MPSPAACGEGVGTTEVVRNADEGVGMTRLPRCAAVQATVPRWPIRPGVPIIQAMRILLTNDDGILAPGIEALYRAVKNLGEIAVVAPEKAQSSQHRLRGRSEWVRRGHAAEIRRPRRDLAS